MQCSLAKLWNEMKLATSVKYVQYLRMHICDWICKKGSYMHTNSAQISPPFYGYIIRQSMCVCFVANSLPVCSS